MYMRNNDKATTTTNNQDKQGSIHICISNLRYVFFTSFLLYWLLFTTMEQEPGQWQQTATTYVANFIFPDEFGPRTYQSNP